jgi:hypothetical protein
MVALLDKRESRAVHGILQDLAKHYPQVELKKGSGIVLD